MHLYFISRGVKHQRDIWVKFMETQLFPWTRKNMATGKDETIPIQGALRPIELWEYVFPEECLDEVMNNMLLNQTSAKCYAHVKKNLSFHALRKALNAEKLPPLKVEDLSKVTRIMRVNGVAIEPIGIRKDGRGILRDPSNGVDYEQELV